jgi:hypothetical protein
MKTARIVLMTGSFLVAGLAGGFARAEGPYATETPHQAVQSAAQHLTPVNACLAERALRDTLYWAVQVYDQCIAAENANCVVPEIPGYPLPDRARLVQLRNRAKSEAEACLHGE